MNEEKLKEPLRMLVINLISNLSMSHGLEAIEHSIQTVYDKIKIKISSAKIMKTKQITLNLTLKEFEFVVDRVCDCDEKYTLSKTFVSLLKEFNEIIKNNV